MNDPRIVAALFAPLILGAITTLVYIAQVRLRLSQRRKQWLNITALAAACAGLMAGPVLVTFAQGQAGLPWLGVSLAVSPLNRLGLIGANVALFCMIVSSGSLRAGDTTTLRMASVAMFAAWLLGGALLVTDRLVSVFCLLVAALAVSIVAAFPLLAADRGKMNNPGSDARLLAGSLKHIAMTVVATGLLTAGMLMLARHALNLENTSMLQVGLGLLVVGLTVRAGAMPYAAASVDLIEAAPQAAILMLGAVTPTVIIVGLSAIAPLATAMSETSPAGSQVALGLGAIGALLAGVRALASGQEKETPGTTANRLPALISCSVALQVGWALFGVFSGSRSGTLGAALLSVNVALAVPLIIIGKEKISIAVGAGALLGLPPLGGFVGALLIAQAATDVNGAWLAVLLAGSAGVATAWLRGIDWLQPIAEAQQQTSPNTYANWLCWALTAAQAAWFVASFFVVI